MTNHDQAPVLFLQRYNVERILRTSSARLFVETELCSGLPAGLPPFVALNVGHDLHTPMPDLELRDDALRVTMSFSGRLSYVTVPWAAVRRCDPLCPPTHGGTPTAARKAA